MSDVLDHALDVNLKTIEAWIADVARLERENAELKQEVMNVRAEKVMEGFAAMNFELTEKATKVAEENAELREKLEVATAALDDVASGEGRTGHRTTGLLIREQLMDIAQEVLTKLREGGKS
jgi:uncharacterized protein (UPF0335 family)